VKTTRKDESTLAVREIGRRRLNGDQIGRRLELLGDGAEKEKKWHLVI